MRLGYSLVALFLDYGLPSCITPRTDILNITLDAMGMDCYGGERTEHPRLVGTVGVLGVPGASAASRQAILGDVNNMECVDERKRYGGESARPSGVKHRAAISGWSPITEVS